MKYEDCKKCPKELCDNYNMYLSLRGVKVMIDNRYFSLFTPCDIRARASAKYNNFKVKSRITYNEEYFDTLEQAIDFELSRPIDLETALALSKVKSMIGAPGST